MINDTGKEIKANSLSDDCQLRNMFAEHCVFTDQRRHDDYANRYADNGRLIMHGAVMAEGRAAVHDWIAAHEMPPGRHLAANVRIYPAGDHARGFSSVMFVSAELTILALREYEVEFVKVGGEWKILEWRVTAA